MPETIVETIAAVRELDDGKGATVRQVADALRLNMSTALRRLRRAEFEGFVSNVEEHKGRGSRGHYRCTKETLTTRGELLPTPEELERAYTTGADIESAEPAEPLERDARDDLRRNADDDAVDDTTDTAEASDDTTHTAEANKDANDTAQPNYDADKASARRTAQRLKRHLSQFVYEKRPPFRRIQT